MLLKHFDLVLKFIFIRPTFLVVWLNIPHYPRTFGVDWPHGAHRSHVTMDSTTTEILTDRKSVIESSENPKSVWYAAIWPEGKSRTSAAVNIWSGAGQRRLMQFSTSLTRPSGAQLEWSLTGLATTAALTPHSRLPLNSAKTVKQRQTLWCSHMHMQRHRKSILSINSICGLSILTVKLGAGGVICLT